ncbi:protein of unknown function (plasmid) [Cupriavidus neocaledonicus]|uniref:Uncharacterized protein n=1 Tax=Cupriavidus neocaledonicus TaxID=1040979 RepID=A0A375HNQ2_9BURK|nr:protein of unknown function [Cupriavidus neocaledonicus]
MTSHVTAPAGLHRQWLGVFFP